MVNTSLLMPLPVTSPPALPLFVAGLLGLTMLWRRRRA
jgi:MYXO-CTERM domain-containing protein